MKKTYYIDCPKFLDDVWSQYLAAILHENQSETFTHFLYVRLQQYDATLNGLYLEFKSKASMILFKLQEDFPMEEVLDI